MLAVLYVAGADVCTSSAHLSGSFWTEGIGLEGLAATSALVLFFREQLRLAVFSTWISLHVPPGLSEDGT